MFATISLVVHARVPARLPLQLLLEPVPRHEGRRRTRGRRTRSSGRPTSPPPHGNFDGAADRATAARTSTACRAAKKTTGRRTCRPERADARRVRMRPIATTRSAAGMPTGRLAVWWVIASEIVIFGGLLALLHHAPPRATPSGPTRPRTPTPGSARFNTLRAAHVEPVGGARAPGRRARRRQEGGASCSELHDASAALTFLVVKAFEWTSEISARLHDHVEHLLVVLLHGRRASTPAT